MNLQSLSIIEIEISHIRVLCDSTIVVEPSTATKPCYCSTDHMYSPACVTLPLLWSLLLLLNLATVLLIICTLLLLIYWQSIDGGGTFELIEREMILLLRVL